MIEEVNKIIYNMLISGRGVFLPEVGTLFIERQGARKISDDKFIGPRNVVNFTSQEQAPSLVSEIVSVAGCSDEQAADIYNRWLMKTRQDSTVTIGGVGVLNHKSFSIESAFASAINPKGVKTLVVRRKSNTWLYAICAICVAVALGIFSYIMWGSSERAASNTAQHNVAIDADSDQNITEDVMDAANVDCVDVATQTAEPAQEVTTPADVSASAAPEVSAATHSDYFSYYVVMGVFSTEQNAERAVAQARAKISTAVCAILPFKGDKYMVTVYGSDSQAECAEFAKANRAVISDLWVYNKR